MDVRRVVTGHDAEGDSVFVTDETISPDEPILLPGAEFHQLWGGDATAAFPGTTTTARLALFMCGAEHSVVRPAQ